MKSVFEIDEPSLAWPKSARIGFYGPRQHRRPMPRRCQFFGQSRWKFLLGAPLELFSAPGGLQERFRRALGAEVARRRRPRRSRRPPGSIFGSQNGAFLGFFRASVAWCFSLAFGQLFVRLSFCLKDVRAPRANGAHADYIVKTNGFKNIFKLCFCAGERRGEQNTHGNGKKTHAKTAPKNRVC